MTSWSVFDRRELRSPIGVAVVLTAYAIWRQEWLALAGLPLIILGWLGSAPNLNLADGCRPIVASASAFALGHVLASNGLQAAGAAGAAAWCVSSLEAGWRSRPMADDGPPP